MQIPNSYNEEGHPINCPVCGAHWENFEYKNVYGEYYQVFEQETICGVCNSTIAYWAYGHFDPIFQYGAWE